MVVMVVMTSRMLVQGSCFRSSRYGCWAGQKAQSNSPTLLRVHHWELAGGSYRLVQASQAISQLAMPSQKEARKLRWRTKGR